MSKKLISLLLSLVLIVGTVAVPGRAADPSTTLVLTLDSNGGKFTTRPGPSDSNQKRYIDITLTGSNGSYPKLPLASDLTHDDNTVKFDGWYESQSGSGNKIVEGDELRKTSAHTLYAKWVKKTQTVTLNANKGTIDGGKTTTTVDIPVGTKYSTVLSQSRYRPTRAGYLFAGWKNVTASFDTDKAVENETPLALTADWKEQFTVTFDPNGGNGSPTTKTYAQGDEYGTLPTPSRTMYEFTGWFDAQTGGTQITERSTVSRDITLYAHWDPAERKVHFDVNEGTLPPGTDATQKLTFDAANSIYKYPSTLPTPTRNFYTFNGWFTSITGGTEVKAEDTVSSTSIDVTLYARWTLNRKEFNMFTEPNEQNVYDSNCKSTKVTIDCGTKYEDIPAPARNGYTFKEWCSDTSLQTPLTGVVKLNGSPDSIYAKWEPKTYTVTLDPNGGEFADKVNDKIDVTYDGNYAGLPNTNGVTKIGYELENWYKTREPVTGENPVKNGDKVTETDTHTLYARWKPTKYKVNLKYNVPTLDEPYDPTIKDIGEIAIDSPLTGLPTSNNVKGYEYKDTTFTFYNWYTKDGAMVNSGSTLTPNMLDNGSVTLSARWKYNVTFYNNTTSSTNPGPGTQLPFITGAKYEDENKFPTPTNTGKTLVGWFTEPVDGTQVLPSAEADGKTTKLYAHWTTSEYVVTLDANGGEFRKDQNVKSWQYTYGDTYGNNVTDKNYVPAPPAGHTFIGWYTEKEGGSKVSATEKVTKTCTLYAHWKADQFKVTLDLGYDSKSTVHTVDYDTELSKVLPSPEPDRTGYAFEGWFEDKAFTKPADTKLKIQADITLYAKWKEAKRVSLDVGGGKLPENTPAYINVYEGGTYAKLPTPTWPGSIFKGWWTQKTGGKQVKPSDTVPAPSSIPVTLYARWESKKITVYLDYNGAPGEAGRTITCSVGDTYKSLPTYLSWAGHEFMGWYTKETGGEKVEKTTIVSVPSDDVEELTLFAHWGYTVVFEPGDGSGTMDKVAAEMDQPYTLPECTFTAPDGMRFGGWAIGSPDAPTQPAGSQYTVVRNLALYATWTDKPITITVTCTSGGSLATDDGKTNTVTAERGTDVTFIARPNAGYELKDLQVDGVSYNYTVEYTFRRIEEDHKIHAVFGRIDAPSYSSCDHGTNCPLSGYRDLNSNAWYHDAVHFCMDNVIMGGSNNSFKPNAKATRAEVATSLWSAEGREPVSGNGPLSKTYPDVAVSDWYYQPIEWATRRGILAGYSNGRFGPNDFITREQLVSVLWRHAGSPKPRNTVLRFNDASKVSGFAWDAMLWATERGIISGRPGGYLAPKGNATRADVAQVLKNYLN